MPRPKEVIICLLVSFCFLFSFINANADILKIYSDQGPLQKTQIYTWPTTGIFESVSDQLAPERITYFKTVSSSYAGWGVFFNNGSNYTMDLSGYSLGWLKFFVKTPVNLKVEIEAPAGSKYSKFISSYGWDGTNTWQEIVIPVADFSASLPQVFSPFMITATTADTTFYVDHVRWETFPVSGTPTNVKVEGRQLKVKGRPFTVKGIAGEFTPIGEYGGTYDYSFNPEDYAQSIPLIKAMRVNTVRTYIAPTQKAFLDLLSHNNIYLIMSFPVDAVCNGAPVDFSDPVVRANIKARFVEMVRHWKSHPGVLMWSFGNEVNLALTDANRSSWYSLVNECAEAAHIEEGVNYHPVTTANSDMMVDIEDYDGSLGDLDVWSLQIYRGIGFGNLFSEYSIYSDKPLLISEFGCDAYDSRLPGENQTMQANYLSSQWEEIKANLSKYDLSDVCIGGVAFSFRDGWWKYEPGSPSVHNTNASWYAGGYEDTAMNEEWWGVVAITDNGTGPDIITPREVYLVLQDKFRVCGDVNGDDYISMVDIVYLVNYLFRDGEAPVPMEAGDMNGDASIDIVDATYLINFLYRNGPAPICDGTKSAPPPTQEEIKETIDYIKSVCPDCDLSKIEAGTLTVEEPIKEAESVLILEKEPLLIK